MARDEAHIGHKLYSTEFECPRCGKNETDYDGYCTHCGEQVVVYEEPSIEKKDKPAQKQGGWGVMQKEPSKQTNSTGSIINGLKDIAEKTQEYKNSIPNESKQNNYERAGKIEAESNSKRDSNEQKKKDVIQFECYTARQIDSLAELIMIIYGTIGAFCFLAFLVNIENANFTTLLISVVIASIGFVIMTLMKAVSIITENQYRELVKKTLSKYGKQS